MTGLKNKNNTINYKLLEDKQLTKRILFEKDDDAFNELWLRYYAPVKSFLKYMLQNKSVFAEDIASDTFVKVFDKLNLYNPSLSFSGWIYRIATNTAIDFLRKHKKMMIVSIDKETSNNQEENYKIQLPDAGLTPEQIFIILQRKDLLNQMLEALEVSYKNLIISKFIKQKTYKELSEETRIPVNTLKTQVRRSIQKLRKSHNYIRKQY